VDKCDEVVMSQTTISNVAFNRIWTLAVSMKHGTERKDFTCILRSCCHTVYPFHCTNHRQIPTFAFGMQASSSLQAHAASMLRLAHGVLTSSHIAIHCINKALFMTSSFRSHNIILLKLM